MAEAVRRRIGYADGLKLTTSICLCYTLLVAGLRTWIRRTTYGIDDIVITAATVLCLGHFAANYAALYYGSGDPWDMIPKNNVDSLNQASLASIATFVLALYTSKAAVVSFLARMGSKQQGHLILYCSCLGFVAVAGLASVLIVLVAWPLSSGFYFAFYRNEHSCDTQARAHVEQVRRHEVTDDVQTTRWAVFTALDLLTEILLLALPVHLLWGLQMKTKEKAKILTAFYLRLPVIAFSIMRLVYTQRICDVDTDVGKESAIVIIFLEIEASYAVVSCTLSSLKSFTSNFNSSFGFGFTQHADAQDYALSRVRRSGKGSGTDSRHDPSPIPLDSSLKSQTVTQDREVPSDRLSPTRGDQGHNITQIRASPLNSSFHDSHWQDSASDGSQDAQLENGIMRHTEYSIRHSSLNDERPILNKPSLPSRRAL